MPPCAPPPTGEPFAQVHAATLAAGTAEVVRWRWGGEVVLKVQHLHMETLMQSDLRNLGRLARVCRGVMPFNLLPVTPLMADAAPTDLGLWAETLES